MDNASMKFLGCAENLVTNEDVVHSRCMELPASTITVVWRITELTEIVIIKQAIDLSQT